MNEAILLAPILAPAVAGAAVLLMRRVNGVREGLTLLVTAANLVLIAALFRRDLAYSAPWGAFEFALRFYRFSAFILLATAGFGFLVALYSLKAMRGHRAASQYYAYLLFALATVNGAVLADHLVALLFFWEGLLGVMFGMIAIGRKGAFKTATKTFIIVGITDLVMLFGIALTGLQAHTLVISKIHLAVNSAGALAMVFLIIGAISKGGSMPFHSWIPDAALDAPVTFMAILPACLEKLLGIYFLTRITMDMFALTTTSWVSTFLMIVGAATILLAVMMALVQKDYKKLLAFHAISQVGYMVLGVGTALPVGIVGGLFHMLNNAMYKACLFLTGGSVERQAGTTDLTRLGGIGRKMPITFACFVVAALSISGCPPFNGFYSKELVYDAALSRGTIFYLAALLGSFFTAASFLKLGHAAYLGKRDPANDHVREAPVSMLVPMIVIAALCAVFGVVNSIPIKGLIEPVLGAGRLGGHSYAGFLPHSATLFVLTVVTLAGALLNHLLGARLGGSGLHAVDHIHYAPGLSKVYDAADRGLTDPYNLFMRLIRQVARGLSALDRAVDWVYDRLSVAIVYALSKVIRLAHTGDYAMYVLWSLAGSLVIIVFLMKAL